MATIEITSQADANRLACPRNHSAVSPTNDHWLCHSCARHWKDVDPEFEQVRDRVTGETYRREDVLVDDSVPGVY